jgi:hypothetical protein
MEEVHPYRAALGNGAFLSPMEPKNKCNVYLYLGERDQVGSSRRSTIGYAGRTLEEDS